MQIVCGGRRLWRTASECGVGHRYDTHVTCHPMRVDAARLSDLRRTRPPTTDRAERS
jgi:hypothetical protein